MRFKHWKLVRWEQNAIGVRFLSGYPEELKHEFNNHHFRADGIELHSRKGDGQPILLGCKVTGGECWTDGTTLYAREQLGNINPDSDDSMVWLVLKDWYESKFGRTVEELQP